MKIRFAQSANASYQAAIKFIFHDNPIAAQKFHDRCEKTLRRLEKHPDSGRRIPEYPELPYRELLVSPYRFFYRVEGDTILVIAVWDMAQVPAQPSK